MEEKTEKMKLQERLKELSLWLHGHSFYNNLTYNPDFDLLSLINRACKFNCTGIEIDIEDSSIENVTVKDLSPKELNKLRKHLDENALEIGIDIASTRVPELRRAVEIGRALGTSFIRCYAHPGKNIPKVIVESIRNLKAIIPSLGKDDLLVIENHEHLRGSELASIKGELGDNFQILYDYGNSVPAGETPEEALDRLMEYIVVAHLKDQIVIETDDGLRIVGAPLGEGSIDIERITRRLLLETPIKIIAMQNVFGYSTTFARDYDEILRQVARPPLIENDRYLIIDYELMRSEKEYREKILNDESLAAEEMVIKTNVVLDSLRQEGQ